MRRDELLLLVGEIKESQVVLKNIHELYVSYSPMFIWFSFK